MKKSSDIITPNLRIIPDFLSRDEIDFWLTLFHDEQSWDGGLEAGRGRFMTSESIVYSDHYLDAYHALLEKVCSYLETIYEEPLVVLHTPSFRKYQTGDSIGWHFDFSRDGDGEVLQLREETRRPGENSPYPAGLHDMQTVLYFNDDYEGGLVRFGEGDWIQPKAGMLITWPSTHKYGHGVSEITSGERYISAMFWMRAKTFVLASLGDLIDSEWRDWLMWPEKIDVMFGNPIEVDDASVS